MIHAFHLQARLENRLRVMLPLGNASRLRAMLPLGNAPASERCSLRECFPPPRNDSRLRASGEARKPPPSDAPFREFSRLRAMFPPGMLSVSE
ncbi:unnamed protein product [Linum trigynum]|uniref:Uncharacterized protein n=1 Tax=Linum trigynum TaxID=586398 RepID=A0AAV2DZM4_9ROSI